MLKTHGDEVACIIMEPMRTELPPAGYLEGVRRLADEHGVVLIFDEVSCGLARLPRRRAGGGWASPRT